MNAPDFEGIAQVRKGNMKDVKELVDS